MRIKENPASHYAIRPFLFSAGEGKTVIPARSFAPFPPDVCFAGYWPLVRRCRMKRRERTVIRKFGFSVLCGVIFLSAAGAVFFCPDEGACETVSAGGIEFTMPAGWVPKSAPGVKAAYDLFYQGKPYAEMYLSEEKLNEPKTAAQVLEDGIRKNMGNLTNYRSLGSSSVRVAGTDGVVHDFSYYIPQTTVQFTGRVLVLVVNDAAYSFFFNTTSGYFPHVKGSFEDIASSVKVVEKPAPPQVQAETAVPETVAPGAHETAPGKRTVEEHCFLLDLTPGWKEAPTPGGAKYRLYNAKGKYLGGFFPGGTNSLDQTIAVMCLPTREDPLQAVLHRKTAENKKEEEYKEIKTEKRTVAGCPALLHDFSSRINRQDPYIQRYCLIAVKDKPDTASVMYPPSIYNFSFLVPADRFEEAKTEIEALLASIRLKTPLPGQEVSSTPAVPAPTAATPEGGQLPELPEQELPELGGEEDHGAFQGPGGKFTVTLPEGTVPDREPNVFAGGPGKASTYTIPGKEGTVIVLNTSGSDADGIVYRNTLSEKLNARLSSDAAWTVEGRDVPVRIFTTADGRVLAAAIFPHHGFFIGVLLPRGEYNEARGWIRDMIMSVKKK